MAEASARAKINRNSRGLNAISLPVAGGAADGRLIEREKRDSFRVHVILHAVRSRREARRSPVRRLIETFVLRLRRPDAHVLSFMVTDRPKCAYYTLQR